MTELASILRAWRDRVSPAAVGMPSGADRRAPGLRREELAILAGLSVDYIVRLEQGRANNPSAQVLASLARALRLTDDERDHLYRVAGVALPSAGSVPRLVPASIQRVIDRLGDIPVSVYTADWDVITWNPMWAALFGNVDSFVGLDANIVWRAFTSGSMPVMHEPGAFEAFQSDLVGDLHAALGRYPSDEKLARLVAQLRAASPEFERLWGEASISRHLGSRKTVTHPTVGDITLDCDALQVPGTDMHVIVYTAVPGSADADKLDLVRVMGLQSFDPAVR